MPSVTVVEIDVRKPLESRILVTLVLGGFVLWLLSSASIAAVHGKATGGGLAAATVMAVFALRLMRGLTRQSLVASADGLVIVNFWRTFRISISDVEGFVIGTASASNTKTVMVVTSSRAVPIDVLSNWRRATLEPRRQELVDWLNAASGNGVHGSPKTAERPD